MALQFDAARNVMYDVFPTTSPYVHHHHRCRVLQNPHNYTTIILLKEQNIKNNI